MISDDVWKKTSGEDFGLQFFDALRLEREDEEDCRRAGLTEYQAEALRRLIFEEDD